MHSADSGVHWRFVKVQSDRYADLACWESGNDERMPPAGPPPDSDSLRTELRILQDEQLKAMVLAAYVRMSEVQETAFDQRRKRIGELLLMLAMPS